MATLENSASVSQQWPYKLANRNVHRPCLQQLDAGHIAFALLHQQSERNDLFSQTPDFLDLEEQVWKRFDEEPTFISQRLFASLSALEHIKARMKTINYEDGVRL
jgi:hypothetical protein